VERMVSTAMMWIFVLTIDVIDINLYMLHEGCLPLHRQLAMLSFLSVLLLIRRWVHMSTSALERLRRQGPKSMITLLSIHLLKIRYLHSHLCQSISCLSLTLHLHCTPIRPESHTIHLLNRCLNMLLHHYHLPHHYPPLQGPHQPQRPSSVKFKTA
jgi:hypothetical protein